MKKWVLLLPVLLCACTQPVTRVDLPGADESVSVPVQDLRPESEKESSVFSYMITSSGYGIYREADGSLDPPMTDVFRRLAYEKLGAAGAKMDISIYHMVVYVNRKSELRTGVAGGVIGGVIGAVAASAINAHKGVNMSESPVDRTQFEDPGKDEYERAFYSDAENPDHASVLVIYIDAAIDGKRVFVKTMAPTRAPAGTTENPYSLAVKSAIEYYLSQYQTTTAQLPPGQG